MTLTKGRRLRRVPGSKFKAPLARSRFKVQSTFGAFKVQGFSTASGLYCDRLGQAGDGGFGNFRRGFRGLVPMKINSGSSPE
jgi:hypothetical protein